MKPFKEQKLYRNPEGLTHDEFVEKHKEIKKIAEFCWWLGVDPAELKKELNTLMEKY